ncbi:hypothetical protein [Pedobacter duraquae]|uniref:Uncharacterized protein n=1 Tax=Pedobacter duraquae TaxID=425511 RepID=A0A4R6IIU2_9SPHI|nr:hypothetical protein [Pedobacter duraquae]TDO21904.1 hypothetical protein CLV32_3012 [Pedobacter duraquae]
MPKTCISCGLPHYAKGFCKLHYRMPSQINPKPIVRKSPIVKKAVVVNAAVSPTKRKAIAPVSKKKLKELQIYRKNRDEYFKQNPVCEFPGCTCRDITLHHMRGRIGALLTDVMNFKSLCLEHHEFVELNPEEAKRLDLSRERLSI